MSQPAMPPTFELVLQRARWAPIPGCPGRYVLRGERRDLSVRELLGYEVEIVEYHVATTPDMVFVVRFPGGGLISFGKSDGAYVHTLNTEEGLRRRLARLGIAVVSDSQPELPTGDPQQAFVDSSPA